uniref:CSON006987 protein n=1 Tax=Culicoides sonorensis TaxID=179676 RepID=A0A336LKX8_CULSO
MSSKTLILIFFLVLESKSEDFFSKNSWDSRIIGGRTASLGQFPYQASLQRTRNSVIKHVCGGSVYNEKWIITAGHCIAYFNTTTESRIVVGSVDLEIINPTFYHVKKFIIHPKFDKNLKTNDIALVQTQNEIIFSVNVKPIPINLNYVKENIEAVTSGWGRVTIQGGRTNILQYLNVTVMSNENCRKAHAISKRSKFIYDNVICTQNERNKKGTCNGDSGGPLVINGTLIGIVSWGVRCAIGLPDVFTRISEHVSWIQATVRE